MESCYKFKVVSILSIVYVFFFFWILLASPIKLQTHLHFSNPPDIESKNNNSLFQYMKGMHFVENENGLKKWEIFAQSAESLAYQYQWDLYGLRLIFYDRGAFQFKITGLKGRIDFQNKNMNLKNKVRILTHEGYLIHANQASYEDKSKSLYISKANIYNNKRNLKAMEAREVKIAIPKDKIFISKGYFFHYGIKTDPLYIVGTNAEVHQQGKISFKQSVMALFSNARLFTDRAELTYKDDNLISLLLIGNVVMLKEKELIFSKRLYIDLMKSDFTFEDEVLWIKSEEKVLANKLSIKNKGKNIAIEKTIIRAYKKDMPKKVRQYNSINSINNKTVKQ